MAHYRGTAEGQDRAVALAGVLLVHAALAAIILSGLNVDSVARTIEHLQTFDISKPPPPPPPPPPPAQRAERAKREAGAPAKKAEASPVVAPRPRIIVPAKPPIVAAPIAGSGSAPSSGAAAAGTGTGAGGAGSGPGGGGSGDTSRFTPARMLNKIPDREYRRIAGGRIPRGSATIAFRVTLEGRIAGCRIVRSSGDSTVDSVVCDAASKYLRFSPARDPEGRTIVQDLTYTPTWRPNR